MDIRKQVAAGGFDQSLVVSSFQITFRQQGSIKGNRKLYIGLVESRYSFDQDISK